MLQSPWYSLFKSSWKGCRRLNHGAKCKRKVGAIWESQYNKSFYATQKTKPSGVRAESGEESWTEQVFCPQESLQRACASFVSYQHPEKWGWDKDKELNFSLLPSLIPTCALHPSEFVWCVPEQRDSGLTWLTPLVSLVDKFRCCSYWVSELDYSVSMLRSK